MRQTGTAGRRLAGTAAHRLACLLCLGLLCALGCGEDPKQEAAAAPVAPGPAGLGPAPLEAELPPLPPRGEVTLELTGTTFTLLANQAPRRAVLRKLQPVRAFEVVLADPQAARGVVTLRLVGSTLEQALLATLSGVAFSLHYAPFENVSLLDGVTVGAAAKGEPAGGSAGEQRRAKRREMRKKLREGRGREQPGLSEDERRQQREEAAAELERGLGSPDARSRAGAVGMLGEEGAAELVDHLANDRSPEVRAASAKALGSLTATRAGTSALVAALDDPDPQVVIAALDSLQWIDDPSVLPDVQKVLDHSDPEVREAAAETVSWLD